MSLWNVVQLNIFFRMLYNEHLFGMLYSTIKITVECPTIYHHIRLSNNEISFGNVVLINTVCHHSMYIREHILKAHVNNMGHN